MFAVVILLDWNIVGYVLIVSSLVRDMIAHDRCNSKQFIQTYAHKATSEPICCSLRPRCSNSEDYAETSACGNDSYGSSSMHPFSHPMVNVHDDLHGDHLSLFIRFEHRILGVLLAVLVASFIGRLAITDSGASGGAP